MRSIAQKHFSKILGKSPLLRTPLITKLASFKDSFLPRAAFQPKQYSFYFSSANKESDTCVLKNGKEEIKEKLSSIVMENGKNIIDLGYIVDVDVSEDGKVVILLKLDQNYRKVKTLCQTRLTEVPWIKSLEVNMAPKDKEALFTKKGGLTQVKRIIAVSSCKGGVGKSTIAVNLAFALSKLGKKVGLFDADVYGPSLPTLIAKENAMLHAPEGKPKEIIPIQFENIKAMSFGFASNKRAVMRGPMVSSIVTQLMFQTQWEELDYLVVDMPPGTGDIQITLGQEIAFDGAVIVTTPQRLSFVDVVKGIEMFDDLKVPTVAVVENMAYHVCTNCNHESHLFGPGYLSMLKNQFGIKNSHAIPLFSEIAKFSDLGSPVVLSLPEEHTITKIYLNIAKSLDEDMNLLKDDKANPPHVRYETGSSLVIVREKDGKEKKIKARVLRQKCQCAVCVDEFSGKKLVDEESIAKDVFPYKIEPKGNYAVAIVWSDGHKSSIYPYKKLLSDDIPAK